MSNPETPKTASDQPVSASVCVVGVLAEALAKHDGQGVYAMHDYDDFYDCSCGDWHSDNRSYDERKAAHLAHVASVVAALPNIAIIEVPSVGYKAVGESDAQRYLNIACRIEDGYHVGGSNSRAAVSQLLRRVSDSLAARAAGGQA